MSAAKPRVPAVSGWFTLDEDTPCLLGQRCTTCGTVVFPPRAAGCPNPRCDGRELDGVKLGRTGRVWSFATNHYPPPPPYVAREPFEPYTVVAVELDDEHLVVLGQLERGGDETSLHVGLPVELVLGELSEGEQSTQLMWYWRAAGGAAR